MYLSLSLGHVLFEDRIFVQKYVEVMSLPLCVCNIIVKGVMIDFIFLMFSFYFYM